MELGLLIVEKIEYDWFYVVDFVISDGEIECFGVILILEE